MSEKITDSGLKYEDLTTGQGEAAMEGQTVRVHYTGWLTDGTKFDSSLDRDDPDYFPIRWQLSRHIYDRAFASLDDAALFPLRYSRPARPCGCCDSNRSIRLFSAPYLTSRRRDG